MTSACAWALAAGIWLQQQITDRHWIGTTTSSSCLFLLIRVLSSDRLWAGALDRHGEGPKIGRLALMALASVQRQSFRTGRTTHPSKWASRATQGPPETVQNTSAWDQMSVWSQGTVLPAMTTPPERQVWRTWSGYLALGLVSA